MATVITNLTIQKWQGQAESVLRELNGLERAQAWRIGGRLLSHELAADDVLGDQRERLLSGLADATPEDALERLALFESVKYALYGPLDLSRTWVPRFVHKWASDARRRWSASETIEAEGVGRGILQNLVRTSGTKRAHNDGYDAVASLLRNHAPSSITGILAGGALQFHEKELDEAGRPALWEVLADSVAEANEPSVNLGCVIALSCLHETRWPADGLRRHVESTMEAVDSGNLTAVQRLMIAQRGAALGSSYCLMVLNDLTIDLPAGEKLRKETIQRLQRLVVQENSQHPLRSKLPFGDVIYHFSRQWAMNTSRSFSAAISVSLMVMLSALRGRYTIRSQTNQPLTNQDWVRLLSRLMASFANDEKCVHVLARAMRRAVGSERIMPEQAGAFLCSCAGLGPQHLGDKPSAPLLAAWQEILEIMGAASLKSSSPNVQLFSLNGLQWFIRNSRMRSIVSPWIVNYWGDLLEHYPLRVPAKSLSMVMEGILAGLDEDVNGEPNAEASRCLELVGERILAIQVNNEASEQAVQALNIVLVRPILKADLSLLDTAMSVVRNVIKQLALLKPQTSRTFLSVVRAVVLSADAARKPPCVDWYLNLRQELNDMHADPASQLSKL